MENFIEECVYYARKNNYPLEKIEEIKCYEKDNGKCIVKILLNNICSKELENIRILWRDDEEKAINMLDDYFKIETYALNSENKEDKYFDKIKALYSYLRNNEKSANKELLGR